MKVLRLLVRFTIACAIRSRALKEFDASEPRFLKMSTRPEKRDRSDYTFVRRYRNLAN